MATVLDDNPYAIRKTQAIPKHSLFGTTLELYSEEERKQLQNSDVDCIVPGVEKSKKKTKTTGEELVALRRKQFEVRKKVTEDARNKLKSLEQDAILMCTGVPTGTDGHREQASKMESTANRLLWVSPKDIEHSREINFGWMPNNSRSYNRDKHGRPPPIYRNAAVRSDVGSREQPTVSQGQTVRQNHTRTYRNRNLQEVTDFQEPYGPSACINLPPNIRHGFGSKVVDSVLSDETKVLATLEKQKLASRLHSSDHLKAAVIDLDLDANGDYNMMGNMTRQNVFPGYSMGNAQSYSKSVYNDKVYLHRLPDTDEYRYKRDYLSMWTEQHLVRNSMDKLWNSYLESLPKGNITWDRDAKRPVPKTEPVAKHKAKTKAKQKTQAKPEAPVEPEEEFVFKTPPLTPPLTPLPEPEIMSMPEKNERDDEFWKFYDESTPK